MLKQWVAAAAHDFAHVFQPNSLSLHVISLQMLAEVICNLDSHGLVAQQVCI